MVSKFIGPLTETQTDAAILRGVVSDNDYTPIPENWYKSFPYAFKAISPSGDEKLFNLPLNPSNINITTHFATNVIATIGGTVEEHAPQRYFDIAIQGTTGLTPIFYAEDAVSPPLSSGRGAYAAEFSLSAKLNSSEYTGGFFAKTVGKLDNALNKARDILGGSRKHQSGVSLETTGYMAFHNFYKFLLDQKKSVASKISKSPIPFEPSSNAENTGLRFISYKDNQEYTCAILRFDMTRSVDNPMLYNYSIQLRAYQLTAVGAGSVPSIDRLQLLGLSGDTSVLSQFKNKISGAKAGIAAVSGAFKSFGR